MSTRKQQKGFTLTEMMITMAIIGILATIAIPSYNNSRLKSNRSDGLALLNEIMQAQERFAATSGTYTTDLTALGYVLNQPSSEAFYQASAVTCAGATLAVCVNLIATAQGGQVNDDNGNGGHLSLNSRGTKVGF